MHAAVEAGADTFVKYSQPHDCCLHSLSTMTSLDYCRRSSVYNAVSENLSCRALLRRCAMIDRCIDGRKGRAI